MDLTRCSIGDFLSEGVEKCVRGCDIYGLEWCDSNLETFSGTGKVKVTITQGR